MTEDSRNSRKPVSGDAVFASGDSGTTKDLITVSDEKNISLNDYVATYDATGTTTATLELYDEAEGTGAGSVTDRVEVVTLDPGDELPISGVARKDIQDDLVALVSGNDADVAITAGAYEL